MFSVPEFPSRTTFELELGLGLELDAPPRLYGKGIERRTSGESESFVVQSIHRPFSSHRGLTQKSVHIGY